MCRGFESRPRYHAANQVARLATIGRLPTRSATLARFADPYVKEAPVAAKSADIRPKITMACTECKERNYITKKNRRNDPDRLDLKKFCPRCRTHTVHRETR